MKKKITVLTLIVMCTASLITGAIAAGFIREIKAQIRQDFTVIIDGKKAEFKTADGDAAYPILHEGTTYLPLRAIGEIMGKTVYWNEAEKTIELKTAPIKEPTVTDADVIIPDITEKPSDVPKEDIPKKSENISNKDFIGEEAAKKAALTRAGISSDGVRFERTELDKEHGIWVYEVDFQKGRTEYSVEINAISGSVVKYEQEIDD